MSTPRANAATRSRASFRWRRDLAPMWMATVAAAGWFLWVCWTQYLTARFRFFDVGHIDSVLFHAFDAERPFHSQHVGYNHFGCHFTPFFYPLAALRSLFAHPFLLVGLGNASLALGGAGAWMMARRSTGSRWIAAAFALLYWRNMWVGSVALANHFESYWVGPAMLALAFLQARRWRWFWGWWIAGMCVKEDLAIYAMALGAWLAAGAWRRGHRASLRHGLALMAVGLAWGLVAGGTMLWVLRSSGADYHYGPRYWPPSIDGGRAAALSLSLLASVGGLALAAPRTLLLAVPPALTCFLSKHELQREILYYYAYGIIPFLFFAAATGAGNILRTARRRGWGKIARPTLAIGLLGVAAWQNALGTRTDGDLHRPFAPTPRHQQMRDIGANAFPADARVMAQEHLYCFVPQRTGLAPLAPVDGGKAFVDFEEGLFEASEYVWIDSAEPAHTIPVAERMRLAERLRREVENGQSRIHFDRDGFVIFQRRLGDLAP